MSRRESPFDHGPRFVVVSMWTGCELATFATREAAEAAIAQHEQTWHEPAALKERECVRL